MHPTFDGNPLMELFLWVIRRMLAHHQMRRTTNNKDTTVIFSLLARNVKQFQIQLQ